jgi:hypothetical protein
MSYGSDDDPPLELCIAERNAINADLEKRRVEAMRAVLPQDSGFRQVAAGRSFWVLLALGCAAVVAAVARAEDDRVVDDVPVALPRGPEHWVDLGANFDTNVFQQHGHGFNLVGSRTGERRSVTPADDDGARPVQSPSLPPLRKRGNDNIRRIAAVCGLSGPQRRKLQLAMEADVRRLAEDIDVERRKYQNREVNFNDQAGQQAWQQFTQDVRRCRGWVLNMFDADSLLMKVLPTTLTPEQQAQLTADTTARRDALWRALVATAMLKFDDVMGLDQKQYEDLEGLLLETTPPLRVETVVKRHDIQHLKPMIVWAVLAKIDARRVGAGLSPRQAAHLEQVRGQGRAMESHLDAQDLMEKENGSP